MDQLAGYGVKVDAKCQALLDRAEAQVGPYYAYNLYDACWYQNSLNPPHTLGADRQYWGPPPITQSAQSRSRRDAVNDYPCGGPQALFQWISTTEVKAALHVEQDSYFFSGDNGVGLVYNITERNLIPFYQHLALNTSLRVLVYNGDTDPGINSFVTQNWTSHIGLRETEEWRPWTLDGKV